MDLKQFATETRNEKTMNLDSMSALEIVEIMNEEDKRVIDAVQSQKEEIAEVIALATNTLYNGGRIIYMGAGTSGRLGVLDAVECPPTFGVDYDTVIGLIAGGEEAFVKAQEGAEDSEAFAIEDLNTHNLNEKDFVIGIAASGRTPYVIGGLKHARSMGCKTASISNNNGAKISELADVAIEAVTGPEVLTGSTRLKAASAQKMILNMISTGAMIGFGKAYENLMVDVMQSNEKLVVRAENIVMEATGTTRKRAREVLNLTQDDVKSSIVMIQHDVDYDKALKLLEESKGHIRNIKLGEEK